jgi:DNA replication protein DnaC
MLQNTEQKTHEICYATYNNQIRQLFTDKQDLDFTISFTGEITKAAKFAEIINKTENIELMHLCVLLFSQNFTVENSQLTIKDFKIRTIEFTKDQKIACRKFVEFMINQTQKTFGLYGFSGTGKTTTLIEIVTYLLANKLIKSVAFSAPTNKAVNVMKNKFEKHIRELYELFSGKKKDEFDELMFDDIIFKLCEYGIMIQFMTIHKLLNFDFDFDNDGKLCFKKS